MPADNIINRELVIQHLGHWPSFHDAEIVSLRFTRGVPGYWPVIYLKIDVIGIGLVELEFQEVRDYKLDGFNHQNVIFDISFNEENELINCEIDTSYGLGGSITAQSVAVRRFSPHL
ncbi:Imm50 family immunity protein [Hymenobacter coccineus]|uniref:Imm50 family immunity protein n=1 Tax=Hymenobacter coccineus TaxID=1908235 RepID=UPI0009F6670D|nr:Imm50 family immunity protein [Hymenobacter coccineus]